MRHGAHLNVTSKSRPRPSTFCRSNNDLDTPTMGFADRSIYFAWHFIFVVESVYLLKNCSIRHKKNRSIHLYWSIYFRDRMAEYEHII